MHALGVTSERPCPDPSLLWPFCSGLCAIAQILFPPTHSWWRVQILFTDKVVLGGFTGLSASLKKVRLVSCMSSFIMTSSHCGGGRDWYRTVGVFSLIPCEQAIIAAAGRRLWRLRESNAAGAHVLFNLMSCPPRLVSSSTCNGLLFRDFITTYSARGLVAVFTETGVHGALDRDRDRCALGT